MVFRKIKFVVKSGIKVDDKLIKKIIGITGNLNVDIIRFDDLKKKRYG